MGIRASSRRLVADDCVDEKVSLLSIQPTLFGEHYPSGHPLSRPAPNTPLMDLSLPVVPFFLCGLSRESVRSVVSRFRMSCILQPTRSN